MKIFSSLDKGLSRVMISLKGVLIVWLTVFFLVIAFIYPLRGSMSSAFGNSLITEKLAQGFDIEVFADLGPALGSMLSYITAGFILIYFIGFVLNAFLTAGLFGSLKNWNGKFSSQEFFRSGSKNFWPFFLISLIITAIIIIITGILMVVPIAITTMSDSMPEKTRITILIAAGAVNLLLMPVFLLIADYSRAWKASHEEESCFRAIGFGFSHTFSKFWSSYLMMVLLIFSQMILGTIILIILPDWRPVTGGGVFLMLIISQLLLLARLMLKTWRYASVTSFMEETTLAIQEKINFIQHEQGRGAQTEG
jgi:hypothetical protein